MAATGADLQQTNNDLVQVVEELKERRAALDRSIQVDVDQKQRLVAEIRSLSARLAKVEDSLAKKLQVRAEFDRTLEETSVAFANILDSSKVLLSSVKREAISLVAQQTDDQ